MKCEIIGWVLVDPHRSEIWVREANGQVRSQAAKPEIAGSECTIQTGVFRRGERIIDAVTLETLGYQMHQWSEGALD